MAASDARPVPRRGEAFRVYFPILDADGDPVSGAASLDSEVSLDGAAFADCTNEATEIGTSGLYYLDLTVAEMTADAVVIRVQTATAGAKTTPMVLYPEEAGDYRAAVTSLGAGVITAASIADGALTAAKFAAGAFDAVWSVAARSLTTFGSLVTDIWAAATRTLTSGLNIALAKGTGVTGFNDLDAAGVRAAVGLASANLDTQLAAIEAQTDDIGVAGAGLTALGDARLANLDAAVSSRLAALGYTAPDNASIAAILTDTATLGTPAGLTHAADIAAIKAETAAIVADTGTGIPAQLNTIAGYIDTEIAALQAAVAALNDVSTADLAAALATYDGPTKAELDAAVALLATAANLALVPTAVQNADALLGRNIAGGSSAGRTVTSALRRIRNRVAIAGGIMSAYQEDDVTVDHTAAVTTAAGDPITEVDPT